MKDPVVDRDSARMLRLLRDTVDVHRAGELQEKLVWAARAVHDALGADLTAVLDVSGDVLAVAGGAPGEVARATAPVLDAVLARVAATGEVAWSPLPGGPEGTPVLIAAAVRAPASPARGAIVAVLPPGAAPEVARTVALAAAAHLAVALENQEELLRLAELEAAQREVVHQLQEAVRPPMPEVDGVELGVHYLPADPGAPTGGDLYDWQVLPDGDLHLAVVDVVGKGVQATKDALAVTHAIRLLALDGCHLGEMVERADGMLAPTNPDLVASLAVARFEPSTGRLAVVGAGQPPVLLVTPEGEVEELRLSGIPIGWPGSGSDEVVERELGRNDMAVFYTDGLVEAGKDIVLGLEELATAAREVARYPAPFLARALVDRALAGAVRRDDTLALVLRRRVPAAPVRRVLGPFLYRFSPSPAAVPLARHLLHDWLAHQPVDRSDREDLLTVATELCANAVRAASGRVGAVALRASVEGGAVVVEVEDDGPGVALGDVLHEPEPDAEAGRGLFLANALCDELTATHRDGRTIVRGVRRAAVVPDDAG